jgi:imidazoleglycerol phosphate synthase glutamine amidotransferase subunit HisH
MMNGISLLAVVMGSFLPTYALKNGLSVTPQMGWNTCESDSPASLLGRLDPHPHLSPSLFLSGNYHGCNISQDIILDAAKQLKASGLQDKGYEYVWIGE